MDFNNSLPFDASNITKPPYQILTEGPGDERRLTVMMDIIMLFAHYLIAFPIFLLCWFMVINFLRRRGHLSQQEATEMMTEMKNIRISMPKSAPMVLPSASFSPRF